MKHKKIKISKHKRRLRMSELYRAKCEQCEQLNRKCRAMESTIKLLRKCLSDAQDQRNEMEIDLRRLYESQKSPRSKKGVW